MIKNIFPKEFSEYLNQNTLIEIKGGRDRDSFLKVWMVQVDERFFSRSWNKSEKSWFTEFLTTGIGQIKFGENIIDVKGKKLPPNDPQQKNIDVAYLTKYTQPENLEYSPGITQPEYADYTMEFIIDQ